MSDPQIAARVTRTTASLGCRISGSGFVSTPTRNGPRYVIALICSPPHAFRLADSASDKPQHRAHQFVNGRMFRTYRWLPITAAAFALATLIAIFVVDGPLAIAIATLSRETRGALNAAVHGFELAFLFTLSKWATGAVLLL